MKFSDIPFFLLNKYFNELDTYTADLSNGSYLIGPKTSIVTKGGSAIEVYVYNEDDGYRKAILTPDFDNLIYDEVYFHFHKNDQLKFSKSSTSYTTVENIYNEGDNMIDYFNVEIDDYDYFEMDDYQYLWSATQYSFKIYDYVSSEKTTIVNGDEVYIRKDSNFHNWLVDEAETYYQTNWYSDFIIRNFLNVDKKFVYFGEIYEYTEGNFYIKHYALKEFTKNALPWHQRTTRVKEIIDTYFDKVYSEVYASLKNLDTLLDPFEVSEEFIDYLVEMYKFYLALNFTTSVKRNFIRNVTDLLKRKGSNSGIYAMWRVLLGGHINSRLNLYERWHLSTLTGQISASQWVDFLYLHKYITQTDTEYISSGVGRNYYKNYLPTLASGLDSYVYKQTLKSSSWRIFHDMDTENVIVQCYDLYHELVSPKSVYVYDENTIYITWDDEFRGYALIKKGDDRVSSLTDNGDGTYFGVHSLATDNAIVSSFDSENKIFEPGYLKLGDGKIYSDVESTTMNIVEGDKFKSEVNAKVWPYVIHNKDTLCIAYCFDTNDKRIFPEKQKLYDDYMELTFSEPVSGYIVVTDVAQEEPFPNYVLTPHYIVEMDISDDPVTETKILDSDWTSEMVEYFEEMRPVDRVSYYKMLISPIMAAFDYEYYDIYSTYPNVYLKSKYEGPNPESLRITPEGESVFFIENSDNWEVDNKFNTKNIITRFYNEDAEEIWPDAVTISKEKIIAEFPEKLSGTAIVVEAEFSWILKVGETDIPHNQNEEVIVDVSRFSDYQKIRPDDVQAVDSNNLKVDGFDSIVDVVILKANWTRTVSTPASIWSLPHNQDYKWIVADFFDDSGNKIIPDKLELVNENIAKAYFDSDVTGVAAVKGFDEATYYTIIEYDGDSNVTSPYLEVYTEQGGSSYVYRSLPDNTYIENPTYEFLEWELPKDSTGYTIKEMQLKNKKDRTMVKTICSDIDKWKDIPMKIVYRIATD